MEQRKAYWFDFAVFAVDHGAEPVSDVTKTTAMEYLSRLRTQGRYAPVIYKRGTKTIAGRKLSNGCRPQAVSLPDRALIFRVLSKRELRRFSVRWPAEN